MDAILLLIAINFLCVPFLQEAEAQGLRLRRFPHFLQILRLAQVRRSRWLRPFCGFTLLLFLLTLARMPAAGVEGPLLALHAAIMQGVLWTVVILSVRRKARAARPPEGPAPAEACGGGASPLRQP